jgi:hypothetical protein
VDQVAVGGDPVNPAANNSLPSSTPLTESVIHPHAERVLFFEVERRHGHIVRWKAEARRKAGVANGPGFPLRKAKTTPWYGDIEAPMITANPVTHLRRLRDAHNSGCEVDSPPSVAVLM